MIEIKDLLAKWGHILLSGESKKETIRRIISETISVEIKSDDIKLQNNTVYLNIKPIYKNEILLKKEKIDSLLEQAFNDRAPQGIR